MHDNIIDFKKIFSKCLTTFLIITKEPQFLIMHIIIIIKSKDISINTVEEQVLLHILFILSVSAIYVLVCDSINVVSGIKLTSIAYGICEKLLGRNISRLHILRA